jgi:hypothetical protein
MTEVAASAAHLIVIGWCTDDLDTSLGPALPRAGPNRLVPAAAAGRAEPSGAGRCRRPGRTVCAFRRSR